jgi:hypothetical protein
MPYNYSIRITILYYTVDRAEWKEISEPKNDDLGELNKFWWTDPESEKCYWHSIIVNSKFFAMFFLLMRKLRTYKNHQKIINLAYWNIFFCLVIFFWFVSLWLSIKHVDGHVLERWSIRTNKCVNYWLLWQQFPAVNVSGYSGKGVNEW